MFLVTNYFDTGVPGVEIQQGKNVADAAKEAKVSHLIFSSLLSITELTGGKLTHVAYFDEKAGVERYIRQTGVPCTFFLAGYFMSNYSLMLRKGEDGAYMLAYPVSEKARFPLLATVEDTGESCESLAPVHQLIWSNRQIHQSHHQESKECSWQTDIRCYRLLHPISDRC